MGTLGQDMRYALRNLRKAPGFAVVAIITLALGIGASTAIFSVIDNILMEPFPYPDAQRFMSVQIHDAERTEPGGRAGFSGPEFLDYVEQNHVFDWVIANDNTDVLYRAGEGTQRFDGNYVTQGTFECVGMQAHLGLVDSQEAGAGGGDEGCGGSVPAVLVPAGTSEAGRFREGGESGFYGGGQPIVEGISEGLSEAFQGATGVADEPGGGEI